MNDNHMMKITHYIESFISPPTGWIHHLEQYAKENNVPIIDTVSIQFLLQLIRLHRPSSILEIGTAIGYSALRMHDVVCNAKIMTIEKNEQMYKIAKQNINEYAMNNNISVLYGDALEVIEQFSTEQSFDFVFIDAAKGQYERYFSKIHPYVNKGGLIVADNVLFRNYVVTDKEHVPKRFKHLVTKLDRFNYKMMNDENYHSSIVPIGDGLLISIKTK